jgi:UDP-N-acetylmuramate--alanine ligase
LNINNYHRVYFLGIGGIGMSALARWFHNAGYLVAGYDKTPSEITDNLIQEGIAIAFDESVQAIPSEFLVIENTLVVYTPAIPNNHKGFNYFKDNGFPVIKRSVALGLLTKNKMGVAVAGTHGKTSTSTTIAWLMNPDCSAFLGGISKNLKSNVFINGSSEYVVVEADEYDRSFLTLYPHIAVITAMDADHLDIYETPEAIYESFYDFVSQIKPGGSLIYKQGLSIPASLNNAIDYFTYSLDNSDSDFYAKDIQVIDGFFQFTLFTPQGEIKALNLGIPGLYNLENTVAAIASALLANVAVEQIKAKLHDFQGVNRRFDIHVRTANLLFIDDYAHHPAEIKACIESIRHLYPNKKITAVFQPHLYSRTRDFANEFAQSLDACDKVILLPIYPARELPIPGINSEIIAARMELTNVQVCPYESLLDFVLDTDIEILVTMGAGNIDRLVKPLAEALTNKYSVL